jgi:hypothetical protein
VNFILALLKAIPILYAVWQEKQKSQQIENIENDVLGAWADKFGQLQQQKRISTSNLSGSEPEQRPDGERDLPG